MHYAETATILCLLLQQDKANAHKKLLDDAEELFRFKEEAKDLVKLLFRSLSVSLLDFIGFKSDF